MFASTQVTSGDQTLHFSKGGLNNIYSTQVGHQQRMYSTQVRGVTYGASPAALQNMGSRGTYKVVADPRSCVTQASHVSCLLLPVYSRWARLTCDPYATRLLERDRAVGDSVVFLAPPK